jgi:hypothetical protein
LEGLTILLELLKKGSVDFEVDAPGVEVLQHKSVVLDRVLLGIEAIKRGADPSSVARILDWRSFERFVARAFETMEYDVNEDFRFKLGKTRRQVDVVATKKDFAVAIDCKHWTKTKSFSSAMHSHVQRCSLLALCLKKSVLPVIVTLGSTLVLDGVPIVASYKLRDFALELPYRLEEFTMLHPIG